MCTYAHIIVTYYIIIYIHTKPNYMRILIIRKSYAICNFEKSLSFYVQDYYLIFDDLFELSFTFTYDYI